ncbi:MAG TPA: bifunctional [glutamate--ammonia ligase]-adenylyl-L-tyrosine phosphorylase/[glutamate--ammonia-ligase] adenylyltransferase [Gammaproteobacteria bacterium]|nr:bifunctional [glutamate--ammonia ligase]-adenylyl-L-tyrosine phosphorylase/[glutamate--ammonia-ligase] adenylyltransferase [Gammaproteobacteria bacterium]
MPPAVELPEEVRRSLSEQQIAQLNLCATCSPWFARQIERYPELLLECANGRRLDEPVDREQLAIEVADRSGACQSRDQIREVLTDIHRREELIIAWRDLTGQAELAENLHHLSLLAELIVAAAVERLTHFAAQKYGSPTTESARTPCDITILGMGKLGGNELNFYSDIDLIAVIDDTGETEGTENSDRKRTLSNQEFYTRVVQDLVDLLQNRTQGSQLYNVDLRLRPFGDSGPLVVTADAFVNYYSTHGREWERYALVKARPIAGSIESGRRLLKELSPFVYRRYLDYGVFASLRELKRSIDQQVERRSGTYHLKLGRGGIREIEFIAQIFQLLNGGRDPALRQPPLAAILPQLQQRGDLSTEELATLTEGYHFLRRSEQRVQMLHHQQEHRLPENPKDQQRLAMAMGYENYADYTRQLEQISAAVSAMFTSLLTIDDTDSDGDFSDEQQRAQQLTALWHGELETEQCHALLLTTGYEEPDSALEILANLRESANYRQASSASQQRLELLMPQLINAAGLQPHANQALSGALRLVKTILRRSAYIALLNENPAALQQLCKLCAAGEWLTNWICQHPVLLDELLDASSLARRPTADQLATLFKQVVQLGQVGDDAALEQQMNQLRDLRSAELLRSAILDINPQLDSDQLLDDTAEQVLATSLQIAWNQIVARHGSPPENIAHPDSSARLLVVGYGKLGARSLSYNSDLDLVLIRPQGDQEVMTSGAEQPTPLHRFYGRVVQRLIHLLTTQTTSGRLYEIDFRLRPSGNAGPMTSDPESLRRYLQEDARDWEHQALVHARPVAGCEKLAEAFLELRRDILCQQRKADTVATGITEMAAMIRQEKPIDDLPAKLKLSPGGMLDIEFFAQYLVLAHAANHGELLQPTRVIDILAKAVQLNLIEQETGSLLTNAYRQLTVHRKLWELRQVNDQMPLTQQQLTQTQQAIQQIMGA